MTFTQTHLTFEVRKYCMNYNTEFRWFSVWSHISPCVVFSWGLCWVDPTYQLSIQTDAPINNCYCIHWENVIPSTCCWHTVCDFLSNTLYRLSSVKLKACGPSLVHHRYFCGPPEAKLKDVVWQIFVDVLTLGFALLEIPPNENIVSRSETEKKAFRRYPYYEEST